MQQKLHFSNFQEREIKILIFSHLQFSLECSISQMFRLIKKGFNSFNKTLLSCSNAVKMFSRKDYVITVVSIYFFSIVLFFSLQDYSDIHENCYRSNCVRFCCNDKDKCNSKFIKTNFNLSEFTEPNSTVDEDYKIYYGKPKCEVQKIKPGSSWEFSDVSDNIKIKIELMTFLSSNSRATFT